MGRPEIFNLSRIFCDELCLSEGVYLRQVVTVERSR